MDLLMAKCKQQLENSYMHPNVYMTLRLIVQC